MKKKLLIILAILLLFPALAVQATSISVDSSYWAGYRSTSLGLTATDGWSGNDNAGFEIRWNIGLLGDIYTYTYEISGEDGSDLKKGLSHWILEVTEPSVKDDFFNLSQSISDGPKPFSSDDGDSNPDMPNSVYGIKWDTSGETLSYSVSFNTYKDPVWGDFYAKDGKDGDIVAQAWNLGLEFGTEPVAGGDFTNYIARPNGGTAPVPEPATMFLLGTGLLGLAGVGRKKLMGKSKT